MFWQQLFFFLLLSPSLYGSTPSSVPVKNATRLEAFTVSSHEVKRDPAQVVRTVEARLKQAYSERLDEIADQAVYAAALAELGDIEQLQRLDKTLQKAIDEALAAEFFPPALTLLLVQAYVLENQGQADAAHS